MARAVCAASDDTVLDMLSFWTVQYQTYSAAHGHVCYGGVDAGSCVQCNWLCEAEGVLRLRSPSERLRQNRRWMACKL